MLQALTLLEQLFDLLVQKVLGPMLPKQLVELSSLPCLEFHFLDERPTSARASWQSQFAHLVPVINRDGL
jgi:hypothetical protein